MIDYLHEKAEDYDNDAIIPEEERQYRERLRLTIGKLRVSKEEGTYWSTDDNLRRLDKSLERERYFISLQKRLIEYLLDKYRI
jgi:hypothetical protein